MTSEKRPYSELANGVIDDVEGVGVEEVQSHFADQCNGINHPRFYDDHQHSPVPESGGSSAQSQQKPGARMINGS